MDNNILYIIVPCYNEEEILPSSAQSLETKVDTLIQNKIISPTSRIIFVNDGSRDHTWPLIQKLHAKNKLFGGISLSRNEGHQNALLAGLLTCKSICDFAITIDADLQDDIDAINHMIQAYKKGYQIVYGVRDDRRSDNLFKRSSAQTFYRLLKFLGAKVVYNHADFRLISKKALTALDQFSEVNLFLRGLIPMLGFPSTQVKYQRKKRLKGTSKYPIKKMIDLAIQGITSLSVKPLQLISLLGGTIFLVSIIFFVYTFFRHFTGQTISGWSSLMLSIWALGGLLMLSLGTVGEYIGKIYLETKHRPRFIVDQVINDRTEEKK